MLTQLHTWVRGALGLSKAVLRIGPADEETVAHRRRLCAMCDEATHRKSTGMSRLKLLSPASACAVCKCNIRAKTSLEEERCPRGKW